MIANFGLLGSPLGCVINASQVEFIDRPPETAVSNVMEIY